MTSSSYNVHNAAAKAHSVDAARLESIDRRGQQRYPALLINFAKKLAARLIYI